MNGPYLASEALGGVVPYGSHHSVIIEHAATTIAQLQFLFFFISTISSSPSRVRHPPTADTTLAHRTLQ